MCKQTKKEKLKSNKEAKSKLITEIKDQTHIANKNQKPDILSNRNDQT